MKSRRRRWAKALRELRALGATRQWKQRAARVSALARHYGLRIRVYHGTGDMVIARRRP
jgi:hypothetical protein